MLIENTVYDEGEIILEPVKIEINDLADLKVGEQFPNSELEETVYYIGKKQVKTIEKSFCYKKKYSKYLKSAKQIKLK